MCLFQDSSTSSFPFRWHLAPGWFKKTTFATVVLLYEIDKDGSEQKRLLAQHAQNLSLRTAEAPFVCPKTQCSSPPSGSTLPKTTLSCCRLILCIALRRAGPNPLLAIHMTQTSRDGSNANELNNRLLKKD
eukprot:4566130-Amphidinium_carterae.1